MGPKGEQAGGGGIDAFQVEEGLGFLPRGSVDGSSKETNFLVAKSWQAFAGFACMVSASLSSATEPTPCSGNCHSLTLGPHGLLSRLTLSLRPGDP